MAGDRDRLLLCEGGCLPLAATPLVGHLDHALADHPHPNLLARVGVPGTKARGQFSLQHALEHTLANGFHALRLGRICVPLFKGVDERVAKYFGGKAAIPLSQMDKLLPPVKCRRCLTEVKTGREPLQHLFFPFGL